MKERLERILAALNALEVRGERNLNLLLASIQELEKAREELARETSDRQVGE